MWSQDNINKVVFTGKRNIEYDGENLLSKDRVTDISVRI